MTEDTLKEQIQAMWEYISVLEASRIELHTMLSEYHEDNHTCNRAYITDGLTEKVKSGFYEELTGKFERYEWIKSIY